MNGRIKELRKSLKLTQEEFATKLNLSRNFIAQIEMGTKEPSDRTIKDICREYSVNEEWLRFGTGEMRIPMEDEEAALVEDLLAGVDNELYGIIKDIMRTYNELDPSGKKVIKSFAKDLVKKIKSRN
jgi:transcriptional regulator with XRE-family HTH domain